MSILDRLIAENKIKSDEIFKWCEVQKMKTEEILQALKTSDTLSLPPSRQLDTLLAAGRVKTHSVKLKTHTTQAILNNLKDHVTRTRITFKLTKAQQEVFVQVLMNNGSYSTRLTRPVKTLLEYRLVQPVEYVVSATGS